MTSSCAAAFPAAMTGATQAAFTMTVAATTPLRMVVAHHSLLVREVLRLLSAHRDLFVVGEADSAGVLADQCRVQRPDVALTEATFADGSQVEACLDDLITWGTRVAVICDDPSPERLTGILARGASAYLRSDASPLDVVDALAAVAAGSTILDPWATSTIMDQWRRMRAAGAGGLARVAASGLTGRETDVLAAMADGLSTKAIALRLGVAPKTVENHKIRIFDKLGVRTQAAAVSLAIGHGLLTDPAA